MLKINQRKLQPISCCSDTDSESCNLNPDRNLRLLVIWNTDTSVLLNMRIYVSYGFSCSEFLLFIADIHLWGDLSSQLQKGAQIHWVVAEKFGLASINQSDLPYGKWCWILMVGPIKILACLSLSLESRKVGSVCWILKSFLGIVK